MQREGVVGLTRSFLAAGVPTVIATHWSIPDNKWTVEIIEDFYRRVLNLNDQKEDEKRKDKAEALRETMVAALKKPELRDQPEIWGAFFLLGLS